jgi:hypothetical protein
MKLALMLLLLAILPLRAALGADEPFINVQVSSSSIFADESVLLIISVSRHDRPLEGIEPEFDPTDDFDFSAGSLMQGSHSTARMNGNQVIRSTRYDVSVQYSLTPTRTGDLTIPAATIVIDGQTYRTNPVPINVGKQPTADFASISVTPSDIVAYQGQAVPMKLEWRIDRPIQAGRMTGDTPPRGAEIFAGTTDIVSTDRRTTIDFFGKSIPANVSNAPRTAGIEVIAPFRFVFDEPGVHTLGPVGLAFTLMQGRGEERRYSATAKPVTVDIRPLPDQGRPDGFNGVVGHCEIESVISDATTRVGDPLTLSVRLKGDLPLARLPAPLIELQPAFTESFRFAPGGWVDGGEQGGWRVYSITLRPRKPDLAEVPAIELPYFDPASAEYRVARSKPIPIKVDGTREVTAADAVSVGGRSPTAELVLDAEAGIHANTLTADRLRDESFDLAAQLASPVVRSLLIAPPLAWAGIAGSLALVRRRNPALARRARLLRRAARWAGSSDPARQDRAAKSFVAAFTDLDPEAVTSRDGATLLDGVDHEAVADVLGVLQSAEASQFGRVTGAGASHTSLGRSIRALSRLLEARA